MLRGSRPYHAASPAFFRLCGGRLVFKSFYLFEAKNFDTHTFFRFIWCGRWDLLRGSRPYHAASPAFFRLCGGRLVFKSFYLFEAKNFDTHTFFRFIWCGRWDLNPHVVSNTRPSTVPVCQFQHARKAPALPAREASSENKSAKVIIHYDKYNYKTRIYLYDVFLFYIIKLLFTSTCTSIIMSLKAVLT